MMPSKLDTYPFSLIWHLQNKIIFLVKDFDCFMDRAFGGLTSLGDTETDNLWKKTLSTLKGEEWRAARRKFTPIFTSDRLKNMMHFMDEAAIDMTK